MRKSQKKVSKLSLNTDSILTCMYSMTDQLQNKPAVMPFLIETAQLLHEKYDGSFEIFS